MAGQAENSGAGPFTHGSLMGTGGAAQVVGPGTHRYCGSCAGLIAEPGVVYGYVGKFCLCASAQSNAMPGKSLSDALREMAEDKTELKQPGTPLPVPPTPPVSPAMTSHDFVVWLRGFFTGRSVLPTDPELEALLRATLDKVKP